MITHGEDAWELSGEVIVARLAGRTLSRRQPLPHGIHWLPGPAVVVAQRFTSSPHGTFLAFSVGEPARLGIRPGLFFSTVAVNKPDVRVGMREHFGLPAEVGKLGWAIDGADRELSWEDRGLIVRGRPFRIPFPLVLPMRALQYRGDGNVLAAQRLHGLARRARVEVKVPEEDPLHWLEGEHKGVMLNSARLRLGPARRAAGLVSTLRAPITRPGSALPDGV